MENKEFSTLKYNTTTEMIEKKSRFIANAYHVESKEEAENKIKELKKEYHDAKHNCFAFRILDIEGSEIEKSSDDGEPSGTAGVQILNVIKKNNLYNVLIVVTRYFGGILLGTGGLTRVYASVASNAIETNNIIISEKGVYLIVEIEYAENEKFKYYCEKNKIRIVETQYSENIFYKIELNDEEYKKIITNKLSNNANIPFNIKKCDIICRKFVEKKI